MQRAKILLNSVSVFPRGAHERVFYGMACGACVVTDESEYLNKYYHNEEDIFYFPKNSNTFDDFFIEKLKNLDQLQK
jgi:spore maturation protein CgeB